MYRSWLCPLHGGLLEECTTSEEDGPEFVTRRVRCRAEDARIAAAEAATNTDRPGAVLTSVEIVRKEVAR